MTEHYIPSSDGTRLAVRDLGKRDARPIVFIHGYLFSSDAFAGQFLGRLKDDYRLISLDLRGHGRSEKPLDSAAYGDRKVWADDVAYVLDALDVERALLVGWSLGSRVAVNYGSIYGLDRVAGFNLVTTVVARAPQPPSSTTPAQLRDLTSPDLEVRRAATRWFIEACAAPHVFDPEQLDAFVATSMETPLAARRANTSWYVGYADFLPRISAPLLVTHGAEDRFTPEAASRTLADAVPSATLSMFAETGHLPFIQRPERFNDELAGLAARVFDH